MDKSTVKKGFRFWLRGLNHLLWPAVCTNCGESISETDQGLCGKCWSQLLDCTGGDYCRRCGRDVSGYGMIEGVCPDCQGREIHFDRISRAGVYDASLKEMILSFKNGRTELDKVLGHLAGSAMTGSGFRDRIEMIVPVPLHWSRRFARGYNQSIVIAKRLKLKSAKINTDLVRVRRTKKQFEMPGPSQRATNVAGAFAVRRGHKFADSNICLIDDIKTSGATLNECAKVLKAAGAAKVFALVLAVAGQHTA